jgi:hypothetical protein
MAAVASAGGCESLGEGIGEFASALTPVTPRQAAEFALDQNDADKRREGIVLLSNAHFGGEPVYVDLYREYVRFDADPMVRAAAISGLARFGEPADARFIAPHLRDANMHVRWAAAKGLQRLHDPEVAPDLIRTTFDVEETADVRSAAAIALGQYPQGTVVQALIAALSAPELSVNMAAAESLHTLTGRDFGLDGRAWFEWSRRSESDGGLFAGRVQYYYPTYSRNLSWLEHLAFWSKPTFEPPGQPAGLTPLGARSTYQEDGGKNAPVPPAGNAPGR